MGGLISDALSAIMNAEKLSKKEVSIKRNSKLLIEVIKIIKDHGYIGGYEYMNNSKGGLLKIHLINKINRIGSVTPRYPCPLREIEDFEKMYLPAAGFGIIIMSTPKGLMTHYEAKKQNIGGTLIAYCY